MKFVLLKCNKKITVILLVVIILLLILAFSAKVFLKSNVEYVEYNSKEGGFSFQYPSSYILEKKHFEGDEIILHIEFHDKNKISHGFVQMWNMPYPLHEFLENSKYLSSQDYKYFNSSQISIGGTSGYFWDYAVITKNGSIYKCYEVFFKKGDKMYRMSYFVPEIKWNKTHEDIYSHMVESFTFY